MKKDKKQSELWLKEWALENLVRDFSDLTGLNNFLENLKTCADLSDAYKQDFEKFEWLLRFIFEEKQKPENKELDMSKRLIEQFEVSAEDKSTFNDDLAYLVNA
ncbi:hypothetical protein KKC59_02440 [bacterium]|nr:hypothetical protein [bacterium]